MSRGQTQRMRAAEQLRMQAQELLARADKLETLFVNVFPSRASLPAVAQTARQVVPQRQHSSVWEEPRVFVEDRDEEFDPSSDID